MGLAICIVDNKKHTIIKDTQEDSKLGIEITHKIRNQAIGLKELSPLKRKYTHLIMSYNHQKIKLQSLCGYFNPIHKGHIEYFQKAKNMADSYSWLNSDYQRKK